jgi:hypothetical protein
MGNAEGKRQAGRLRRRWMDIVKTDFKRTG